MTHWLSIEQFGQLGLITALAGFFGLFLVNPVGQHINRHTHEWHKNGMLPNVFYQYNYYLCFISTIAFITGFIWPLSNNHGISVDVLFSMAGALGLAVWLGTWNTTLIPMLNMLENRNIAVTLSLFTALVSLSASVFFVQFQPNAISWFYGQLLGLAVGSIAAYFFIFKKIYRGIITQRFFFISKKEIYHYCLPLAVATGLMWCLFSGHRFIIGYLYGERTLGLMVLGFGVAAQYWNIVENITTQIVHPKFYFRLAGKQLADKHIAFNQMLNIVIPTYIVLAWVGISSAPHILSILSNAKYEDSIKYCIVAMVGEMSRVITNTFNQVAQIEKNTITMIQPYLIAIFFLVLGFIVIFRLNLSVYIASFTICSAIFVAMLFAVRVASRQVKICPEYRIWALSFILGLIAFIFSTIISIDTIFMHVVVLIFYGMVALLVLYFIVFKGTAYKLLIINTNVP